MKMIKRIFNFINIRILNPIQSLPVQWYYFARNTYSPLNDINRKHHIVVSLTSFPVRFGTLHFAIKSILNQSMKPDVIFLCLTKEEIKDQSELPKSVLELKKYGLQIFYADDNLKPHNKYISVMKLYPNSLIITIDDDNMYDKNLVKNLYHSYLKYPTAVSAKRVHKIRCDSNMNVLPYNKWLHEYKKELNPSFYLLATGVGGVLYPPGILPPETFDETMIRKLCLNADDIWLKFMELKNDIPVVWTKGRRIHPFTIRRTQKVTLARNNINDNLNDKYLNQLQNYYGIKINTIISNK